MSGQVAKELGAVVALGFPGGQGVAADWDAVMPVTEPNPAHRHAYLSRPGAGSWPIRRGRGSTCFQM
jgi:hypothetical protein